MQAQEFVERRCPRCRRILDTIEEFTDGRGKVRAHCNACLDGEEYTQPAFAGLPEFSFSAIDLMADEA